MTTTSTSFRSISNITVFLIRLSIAGIILDIIYLAGKSYQTLLGAYDDSQFDIIYLVDDTIMFVISILIIIFGFFWIYQATKNIHSFGAKEVISPKMAVIWWFIPIANLWKPYKNLQQIWKASNPETKLSNGTEWRNTSSSNNIKLMWILLLVSVFGWYSVDFIYRVSPAFIYNDVYSEQFEESNQGTLFLDILLISSLIIGIISTIYFIRIIRQISTTQELKSI